MEISLSAKKVWIFGATGKIGQALTQIFLENNCHVIAQGYQNTHLLNPLLESYPDQLEVVSIDLRDSESIQGVFHQFRFQSEVEICIHSVAIAKSHIFPQMTSLDWDDVMNINLKSLFWIAKYFYHERYQPQKSSHFLAISSLAGKLGSMGKANYATSKGAIIGFLKSLAHEWAPDQILVNTIIPGWVDSNLSLEQGILNKNKVIDQTVLKKESDPFQIAKFIAQIAQMDHISGQVLNCDSRIYP